MVAAARACTCPLSIPQEVTVDRHITWLVAACAFYAIYPLRLLAVLKVAGSAFHFIFARPVVTNDMRAGEVVIGLIPAVETGALTRLSVASPLAGTIVRAVGKLAAIAVKLRGLVVEPALITGARARVRRAKTTSRAV
jgi:hypothetical protein